MKPWFWPTGRMACALTTRALVAGMALQSASALAQGATPPSQAKGKAIATARCAPCHGVDGQAPNPEFPKLAGQLQEFLVLQLRNYKSGERPHPVMATVAKPLAPADIDDVAAYYASLPPMRDAPGSPPVPAAMLALGESVFRNGKPGAPACQYCHGARGQGVAPVFARLAGQHATFVVASIQPYRKVDDFKNPYAFVMKAVVQNLSDAEIDAVAHYVQAMK